MTGASGFVGSHMLGPLSESYEVHCVSRLSEPTNADGVVWHASDLMDPQARSELFENVRPTHLVHLAWVTDHNSYWSSPDNLDWVVTSLMILREFEDRGGQRAVMIGTCAEYDWTQKDPYSESSPTVPRTLYGACKLATGIVSRAFSTERSISLAWARLFYPYGPREHPDRLVPSLVLSALQGETPVPRTPGNVIDLMYVADVASALGQLLTSNVEGVVNICTGRPVPIHVLASVISELAGLSPPDVADVGVGRGEAIVGDPTRLHSEVGYTNCRTLAEGLLASMEWWRENRRIPRREDRDARP